MDEENLLRKQANLRLYLLFKYSIVDETVFPKGMIMAFFKSLILLKSFSQ